MDADVTAIGTRRPREGRCDRCDRPLTDLVWTTWTPIALWGPEMPPVTDWREDASADDSRCMGEPFCDEDAIDWKQRARAAEADLADAEARGRKHGLLAAAWLANGPLHILGDSTATARRISEQIIALAAEATDDE